jgi:hypothetical protein
MVPSHRASASPRPCSLSGADGIFEEFLLATIWRHLGQSHGRGDPGQPCHDGWSFREISRGTATPGLRDWLFARRLRERC